MEKEKDEAKVARLAAIAVGETKARPEDDLTRVRDSLAATEEDGHELEAEVARLTIE